MNELEKRALLEDALLLTGRGINAIGDGINKFLFSKVDSVAEARRAAIKASIVDKPKGLLDELSNAGKKTHGFAANTADYLTKGIGEIANVPSHALDLISGNYGESNRKFLASKLINGIAAGGTGLAGAGLAGAAGIAGAGTLAGIAGLANSSKSLLNNKTLIKALGIGTAAGAGVGALGALGSGLPIVAAGLSGVGGLALAGTVGSDSGKLDDSEIERLRDKTASFEAGFASKLAELKKKSQSLT